MARKTHQQSDATLRSYMRSVVGGPDTIDSAGEVIATVLAEAAAAEFDCHHRLDDETDSIWDVALAVAEESNR